MLLDSDLHRQNEYVLVVPWFVWAIGILLPTQSSWLSSLVRRSPLSGTGWGEEEGCLRPDGWVLTWLKMIPLADALSRLSILPPRRDAPLIVSAVVATEGWLLSFGPS